MFFLFTLIIMKQTPHESRICPYIYNGIISPSLKHAKIFNSIPDEQSQQEVPGSWANHMHSDLLQMGL